MVSGGPYMASCRRNQPDGLSMFIKKNKDIRFRMPSGDFNSQPLVGLCGEHNKTELSHHSHIMFIDRGDLATTVVSLYTAVEI